MNDYAKYVCELYNIHACLHDVPKASALLEKAFIQKGLDYFSVMSKTHQKMFNYVIDFWPYSEECEVLA